MGPNRAELDLPAIIAQAEEGNLAEAFHSIQLRGVGHKIASFFLRDVITLTQSESKVTGVEKYLYCQPIDIWVGYVVDTLDLPMPASSASLMVRKFPFRKMEKLEIVGDFCGGTGILVRGAAG